MVEEIKGADVPTKNTQIEASAEPISYEKLVKKEANDILALWVQNFPLDEE